MVARSKVGILLLLAAAIIAFNSPIASALIIFGGEGNTPIKDPGWPKGAAAIFNVPARIAWIQGPPFGGGQWHAECRGDAKALSAVLADFDKLDVKSKRIVLHDGVGASSWLNMNKATREAAKMDWCFMVWQPESWEHQRKMPPGLSAIDQGDAENGPPAQIDVYTGGKIKWADVVVPPGIKVVDNRLVTHGFTPADGVVLEGKVIDLATKRPIAGRLRLEKSEARGGFSTVAFADADKEGHWLLKKTPAGSFRVVIEAEGYVARLVGYVNSDEQSRWHGFDTGLSRPAFVAGRVIDAEGHPLADVNVQIQDATTSTGTRYKTLIDRTIKTGADGRFRADQVPAGKADIHVFKDGYCRVGLAPTIVTPKEDFEITMIKAGEIIVTVDFAGKERPKGYIVEIEPEGGKAIGKRGGGGNINDHNQYTFKNVPPERYVIHGHPNPSSADQKSAPVTVDLKSGQVVEIKLNAK